MNKLHGRSTRDGMGEDKKSTAICRVCLNYDFQSGDGKGVSLFEEYNDCVISDKIKALAHVVIKEGDGLPDRICLECLLELENAFKFKLKCERTNEVLLSVVSDARTFEGNDDDVLLNIKEEYLDDIDTKITECEELDHNLTADLEDSLESRYLSSSLETEQPVADPPKPSKAIDLKLICHDCGGSFKSKCKLRVHWKKEHLTDNLKCENCLRKFKSYAAYNSHKQQNLISCLIASKVRIEGEGKNRIFHCKECNYHSKRIQALRSHIVIHSGERPFQCDLCLNYFTQISAVITHKERVHKVYKSEGTCHYCGKYYKGRSRLNKHLQTHKLSESHTCKICKVVLKYKKGLQAHMKRHAAVKTYTCEICPASFYGASELWHHKERVHIKSKRYTCEICKYTSLSTSVLKKHMVKHSASNIGCNVCGLIFENEVQLEHHKKRHTDRNYRCPHCDKTYYSRKNMNFHIRDKHKFVVLNEPPARTKISAKASKRVKSDLSAKDQQLAKVCKVTSSNS